MLSLVLREKHVKCTWNTCEIHDLCVEPFSVLSKFWVEIWNWRYGNCFTFNPGADLNGSSLAVFRTTKPGPSYGMFTTHFTCDILNFSMTKLYGIFFTNNYTYLTCNILNFSMTEQYGMFSTDNYAYLTCDNLNFSSQENMAIE